MHTEQFELHAQIEERHWWFVARRQIVRQLLERLLPPSPETVVADVGCGTGANLAALADRYRCVGIDVSAEAIALARSRFPAIEFLCGTAPEGLGDWQRRLSALLLMDVMEHVEDDFALLANLVAALPVGGYLILTVPADMSLWTEHDMSFGHYRRYDLPRLQRTWQGLPVTPLVCSYYNTRLYPAVKLVRTINRLRGGTGGAAGTDFNVPRPAVNRCLERVFAGESKRLLAQLGGDEHARYARGVSLITVLRREMGKVVVPTKPVDLAPDFFNPQAIPASFATV